MSSVANPTVRRWGPNLVRLLYVAGLAPAVYNFYLGATGNLGADPVNIFEIFLGLWAVRFLILTLAVSPLREIFGVNLIRYRRVLGLLCFYYALMHFLTYLVLDQRLMLSAILADVTKRPFIMMGAAALVLLVPLALTSNAFSIRRLGKAWLRIHRLIYLIAMCGAIHFALATKVLSGEQYLYLTLTALLLAYRLVRRYLKRARGTAGRSTAGPRPNVGTVGRAATS
jgi:methionine sulfoxide reductase heme-binding subunit